MTKPRWLDRRIALPGPFLALALDQDEFDALLKHCKHPPGTPFVKNDHSHATTHVLTSSRGVVCIVALRGWEKRSGVEIAGLLVHEAVHIWQEYAASMGEHTPGAEQEAYAVQSISQELMAEFARRVCPK